MHAFDVIDTDIVLYLQEDYFLHAPVQAQRLQHFVELMQAHDITYLGLSEHGNTGPFHRAFHPELWAVDAQDPYRTSLQACLINTRRLRRYVLLHY